jgi:CDP-diacylglycerol--glycerol-3-phosphate 3-phosphatidyltransferase
MTLTWVPNALTVARCVLAIVVAWLILVQPVESFIPAVAFIVVALTDFADGWAARRLNAVSAFGAFLDPVADKLLVGTSLFALVSLNNWAWPLLVPTLAIVIRDVLATGLRLIPSIEMPVSKLAKWKTALEMIGILGLLLAAPFSIGAIWTIGLIIVWLAAALSVYTLGLYCGALLAESKRPHS